MWNRCRRTWWLCSGYLSLKLWGMWHRAAWTLLHDLDVRATSLLENSSRQAQTTPPRFPGCLGIVLVPDTNSVHVNPCYPRQCLDSWDAWAENDSRRKRLGTMVLSSLELNSMGGSGREGGFCQIKVEGYFCPILSWCCRHVSC